MQFLLKDARESLVQRRSRLQARCVQGQRVVQQEASTLSEQERQELRDIEDALARFQEGGFGLCSRCGGAIGRYRLLAIPEARYCVTCNAVVSR
ncbi:TraR/DksA family transcriptional regulator [Hyalangium sp.]|uniref:TraR/DksA family transcriptional regulator n=1 Tax=Hyalangium sp. TaxID=2028555 RepID=UPI002D71CD15|nr:TraR/DksA family transcriptional regulator [Hyalangium sp.]HYH99950.1 TraR/DksA family transcriptional regulator [Hyalangium sp.]